MSDDYNVPALPDDFLSSLVKGITESHATTMVFGGKPLLRMLKTGDWVFGQSNDMVQEGSHWAVNPTTLKHGWCCWVGDNSSKNVLKGEVMAPMTDSRPPRPPAIDGTDYGEQFECDMKCLDGDDADTEVRYKTNSLGGKEVFMGLTGEIKKRVLAGEKRYLCPVLTFDHTSYNHPSWGVVLKPVLVITGWVDINGQPPDSAIPLSTVPPTQAATAAPARKRKAPLNAAAAEQPVAPMPTAAVHAAPNMPPPAAGQRRRPSRPVA